MCVLKGSRSSTATSGENIRECAAAAGAFFWTPMKTESCESLFSQTLTGFPVESVKNLALAMLHASPSLYGHVTTALRRRQTKHVEHLSES